MIGSHLQEYRERAPNLENVSRPPPAVATYRRA